MGRAAGRGLSPSRVDGGGLGWCGHVGWSAVVAAP